MVQGAIVRRANGDAPLVKTRNVDQARALVAAQRWNELVGLYHWYLLLLAILLVLILIIVLYICGIVFSMMLPNQLFDSYNPNATYVPLFASIGYYSTPSAYKRGHCAVIDHGDITHSVVKVEEYYCGPRVQLDIALMYLLGKDLPPIQWCSNMNKNVNLSTVYCLQDEDWLPPWCAVKLRQNVTLIAEVTLNVTSPLTGSKGRLFHSPQLQIKGTHTKLPTKATWCDYLMSVDGAISEAYLEMYEFERSNHSWASGFVIGFLMTTFILWYTRQ